jgi:hypothetical protein
MKVFIIIAAFVLGAGAYYVYDYYAGGEVVTVATPEPEPTVDTPPPPTSAAAQIAIFENSDYNFTFKYRIKPYGYSIFENSTQQNLEMETLFGVTLVRSDDYNESVKAAAEGNAHDGPPSMSVYVFSASKVLDLEAWLIGNRMITNCVEGEIRATTLAGADAMSCLWDGLYPGITVAQIRDNKIYVLIGTRESVESPDGYSYEADFNDLVESFILTN